VTTKNLAEIIKANPGCVAIVDNDGWTLHRLHPSKNPFPYSKAPNDYEEWEEGNLLASDSDAFDPPLGDGGYGSGCSYGGDLLQALAQIVGVKVESV
jgi:hypothetical protein